MFKKRTFRARSAQASLSCASADAVTIAEAETALMLEVAAELTSAEAAAALGAVRDAMKNCETETNVALLDGGYVEVATRCRWPIAEAPLTLKPPGKDNLRRYADNQG